MNGLPFDRNLGRIFSYQDRLGMWLNHRMTQIIASFVGRPVRARLELALVSVVELTLIRIIYYIHRYTCR